jgi:hypothetical protein
MYLIHLPFAVTWNFPVWRDTVTDLFGDEENLAIAVVCHDCNIVKGILNEDIWLVLRCDLETREIKYHSLSWDKREVVV